MPPSPETAPSKKSFPSSMKIVVAAGTYDGVLAGWELSKRTDNKFRISFASPVHGGSVRSLCLATKKMAVGKPKTRRMKKARKGGAAGDDGAGDGDDHNDGAGGGDDHNEVVGSLLLSCGYDETLQTHDLQKRLTASGQVRTPSDYGTPVCSSFAPPGGGGGAASNATHCLVGFTTGKLLIYKKRDWTVQHVLAGHDGGVAALAVHPSALLALSGGQSDGKLKLWDLATGRMAHVDKIRPAATTVQGRTRYDPIASIVWLSATTAVATSDDDDDDDDDEDDSRKQHDVYGFCYGSHVTVRDVETGKDLLDVELPSKVNQIALLHGPDGVFVVAACNDGSLPVVAVTLPSDVDVQAGGGGDERRAIMAIEPVDRPTAGEERFKCVQAIGSPGYLVAAANSGGVVSLMDLEGAVKMIVGGGGGGNSDIDDDDEDDAAVKGDQQRARKEDSKMERQEDGKGDAEGEETPVHPETDGSSSSDEEEEAKAGDDDNDTDQDVELAVDLIDSIRLGTGARITCLAAWSTLVPSDEDDDEADQLQEEERGEEKKAADGEEEEAGNNPTIKRKRGEEKVVVMDSEALDKARELVAKAKKIQKRKHRKKQRHGHHHHHGR